MGDGFSRLQRPFQICSQNSRDGLFPNSAQWTAGLPYAIYILIISMRPADEAAMAEFYNDKGELFGRTLASEWLAPISVQFGNGSLRILSNRQYWSGNSSGRWIRPPQGLLDSFIALADAPSDEKIGSFATQYGGLQIFYNVGGKPTWPLAEHIEYCEVWRYFARVTRALLRIASNLYRGGAGSKEDWDAISKVPSVMRETAQKAMPGILYPFPLSDEANWLALAHFVAKGSQQTRVMFAHLVNTLLGLGCVRPWFTWSDGARKVIRPQIAHSGRSLLSQLALQLCLRLAKVDALLVCVHCQQPYSPVVRAPKAGQRNFCPECRTKGVPQNYALKDFRKRRRQSRDR
jgi:hypothetical protein